MLNPFKKKDNEFKLDDYSLPSLGDSNQSNIPSNEEINFDNSNENPSYFYTFLLKIFSIIHNCYQI